MDRLKITDGDFVVIQAGYGMSAYDAMEIAKHIKEWCVKRGLNDVQVASVPAHEGTEFKVYLLSVNDVFEEMVLKGNNVQK